MNILIIGATSGIGKSLFEKYVTEGNRLGIVGRRTHLLDELRQEHPDTTFIATADIAKQDETERAIVSLYALVELISWNERYNLSLDCSNL